VHLKIFVQLNSTYRSYPTRWRRKVECVFICKAKFKYKSICKLCFCF